MEKIILNDGQSFNLSPGAGLDDITVEVDNFAELGHVAEALTAQNALDAVQFESNGTVTGEYERLKLVFPLFNSVDYTENGKVLATFSLRERTETEKQLDEIRAMSEENAGQITDLQMAMVEVYEGLEV